MGGQEAGRRLSSGPPPRCHFPLWVKDQHSPPYKDCHRGPGHVKFCSVSSGLSHLPLICLLPNAPRFADIYCPLVLLSCPLGPGGFNLFYFVIVI